MKKTVFLLIALLLLIGCLIKNNDKNMFKNIRQTSFAGQYYPAEVDLLRYKIENYLSGVEENEAKGDIKAIIVPHASYEFSANVAALGFKLLQGKKINTAIIISNSHADYFDEIVIDNVDAWQIPMGVVGIDKELAEKLVATNETIQFSGEFFGQDQTLEVQVPFLQSVVEGEFKILPIYFGNTDNSNYQALVEALAKNIGDDDVLIISTDMSHYPVYEDANRIDKETLNKIKTCNVEELEKYAKGILNQGIAGEQTVLCGIDGVKTAMVMAKALNWEAEILGYENSGDAIGIGDQKRVVGYGAIAFFTKTDNGQQIDELNNKQKEQLLDIAKETVENFVKNGKISEFKINDERLKRQEGAFVTIKKKEQLRGCIGQIIPSKEPLWQVVRDMAIEACSKDYRFDSIDKKELSELEYEISVLSAPEKINSWKDIEMGKHGVIVKKDGRSGVFLPQVADETGWSQEEFLSQLCLQKAGLEPDCYKNKDTELLVFTVQVF